MKQCPKCRSEDIHRSRAKSKWEGWRQEMTRKRPHRCQACGWRGWGVDTGPRLREEDIELATRAMTPDPPILKDTTFALKAGDATVDLTKLDTLPPPPITR